MIFFADGTFEWRHPGNVNILLFQSYMWRNSSKKPFLVFDIFGLYGDDVITRFQIDQKTLLLILIGNIGATQRKAWFHIIVLIQPIYDNSRYERLWLKMALSLDFNS